MSKELLYPKIKGRRSYPRTYIKIINVIRDDIVNMIIGGLEPTQKDVERNWARYSGLGDSYSLKWYRPQLRYENMRDLLTMYRTRTNRKVCVK